MRKKGLVAATAEHVPPRPHQLPPPPLVPCLQAAQVKSLHYKRLPVSQVVAGQTAAVALKKVKRSQVCAARASSAAFVSPCCTPARKPCCDALCVVMARRALQPRAVSGNRPPHNVGLPPAPTHPAPQVRKGMVLLDARVGGAGGPHSSWEFTADIAILTHSTTIAPGYQVRGVGLTGVGAALRRGDPQ